MPLYNPTSGIKPYTSSSDPGVGNDNTQGYSVGSLGLNTSTARTFVARDVSTGAAVWTPTSTVFHPGYVVNNWYSTGKCGTVAAGGTTVAGSIYCSILPIYERLTVHALGIRITTISGTANLSGAIYKNDPSVINRPGAKVDSLSAPFNTGSATSVSATLNADQQIEPGVYWLCVQPSDTTVKWASYPATGDQFDGSYIGSATIAGAIQGNAISGVSTTGVFGTWPSNLNGSTWTEIIAGQPLAPFMAFQPNSVP